MKLQELKNGKYFLRGNHVYVKVKPPKSLENGKVFAVNTSTHALGQFAPNEEVEFAPNVDDGASVLQGWYADPNHVCV